MALPYLDIRDAIQRIKEKTALVYHSIATIYFTKGVHFIPLEDEGIRYMPSEYTTSSHEIKLNLK